MEVIGYQGFNTEDKKNYRLYQHDMKNGNNRLLLSLDDYIGHFSIAPEAKRIAFERGKRHEGPYSIWGYDLPTKQLQHLVDNGSASMGKMRCIIIAQSGQYQTAGLKLLGQTLQTCQKAVYRVFVQAPSAGRSDVLLAYHITAFKHPLQSGGKCR